MPIYVYYLFMNRGLRTITLGPRGGGVRIDDYNYDNKAIADIILEEMENVKFLGISVTFSVYIGNISSIYR